MNKRFYLRDMIRKHLGAEPKTKKDWDKFYEGINNTRKKLQEKKEKLYDICYSCGKSDEHLSMNELNEIDFDIFCDACYTTIKKGGD